MARIDGYGTTYIGASGTSLADLREDSEQLEQFAGRDFSSVSTEMAALLPAASAAGKLPPEVDFSLVARVAEDVAQLYVLPPTRHGLPAKLARVYQRSGMDTFLRACSERLVYQRTQVLAVDTTGQVDRIGLHAWSPHQVRVEFADPLGYDIRDAERVECLVPLAFDQGRSGIAGLEQITYGRRIYTRQEAWLETTTGERVRGLYPGGSSWHGLGRVPLVAVRWGEPVERAHWFPQVASDLLSLQITVISQLSQILRTCEIQIPGREVISGPGAKSALAEAPTGAWAVRLVDQPSNDATQPLVYQWVQGTPPIDLWISAIDKALEIWSRCNHVNPGVLVPSRVITGDGIAQERLDAERQVARQEQLWSDAEQALAELVGDTLRLDTAQSVTPSVGRVRTEYRYVEPRTNDLQAAQARAVQYAAGELSPAAHVAKRDSLTLAEAEAQVAENLESTKRLSQPTQGLDRIARARDVPADEDTQ